MTVPNSHFLRPAGVGVTAWLVFTAMHISWCPAAEDSRIYTQKPELQQVEGAPEIATPVKPQSKMKALLKQGPAPHWIWSAAGGESCVLRTTFEGGASAALLQATCDNSMTVYLNGARITQSDTWEAPVTVDVQKHVKAGSNLLEVEARNAGGISGFVLKMVLTDANNKPRYIVSGNNWQAAVTRNAQKWAAVKVGGKLGVSPWGNVFNQPLAGGAVRGLFQAPKGFQVEKLFTVPRNELGSWVSIAFDNKGRLLASDQGNKGICRITLPPVGSGEEVKVEHLDLKLSASQGMLYANNSLYLSINGGPGSGLYRARDTNGDDQYDEVKKLKSFRGGGEHGPHALRLAPDGQSIYVIAGNHTAPPEGFSDSRIPSNWQEDLLLPRQWDANGHARGKLAPGGWIAKTDFDGESWEIFSMGYRNPYDMDFNADGELFAYDADMEWDMGSPWYRPTRVVHATSGSEFGWRSGTGKWPAYYADSLPPLVNIGPGSPVGAAFGYGAKFPAKYQKALYICDWTFGTIYSIFIEPDGASYKAVRKEFVSRTPLQLTDVAIGPDGAMYFTIGGRGTQSELFRVTYTGDEPVHKVDYTNKEFAQQRALRAHLEKFHTASDDVKVNIKEDIWPHLSHSDRHIRYAARIALEHRPMADWMALLKEEHKPQTLITAVLAAARQSNKPSAELRSTLLEFLGRTTFRQLSETQQLEIMRAFQLVFIRLGKPSPQTMSELTPMFEAAYPAGSNALNRELVQLLVYLESPQVVAKTIPLLSKEHELSEAASAELLARNRGYGGTVASILANRPDEQQIHYAFTLRNVASGWLPAERMAYFKWFQKARTWKGGSSFQGFLRNMETEALAHATDTERLALQATGLLKPYVAPKLPTPSGKGQHWEVKTVLEATKDGMKNRSFANGQKMFAAARCIVCHRFGGEGGSNGPDLTQVAGRFSLKDLTEAIIEPSKVVSDQYRVSLVVTEEGEVITSRLVAEDKDSVTLVYTTDNTNQSRTIPRDEIEEIKESPVSIMAAGLIDVLNKEEMLDLMAYLLSRGNAKDPMFKK